MNTKTNQEVIASVRQEYEKIALGRVAQDGPGCCGGGGGFCGASGPESSLELGYTEADLASVPEGANLGLGCGNPQAIAALRPGETVLDLGSGAGFDCFLAAQQVGQHGRVFGVDMTHAMLEKARHNASKTDARNVKFLLGEIEHLPLPDASIDVVLSNCVVNLSPDKATVFAEAFRVLKPGGRLAISDVVLTEELPPSARENVAWTVSCVGGAISVDEHERLLTAAGFKDVHIAPKEESRSRISSWLPGGAAGAFAVSASITAVKPPLESCCGPTCCAGEGE